MFLKAVAFRKENANVCVRVCAVRNTRVTAEAERICFYTDTDGWIEREKERERWLNYSYLPFHSCSCLIPSLDHKLLLDTNTK